MKITEESILSASVSEYFSSLNYYVTDKTNNVTAINEIFSYGTDLSTGGDDPSTDENFYPTDGKIIILLLEECFHLLT